MTQAETKHWVQLAGAGLMAHFLWHVSHITHHATAENTGVMLLLLIGANGALGAMLLFPSQTKALAQLAFQWKKVDT